MATDKNPAMPEIRLSPDGTRIAHHWNPESPWSWAWVTVSGSLRSGAYRAEDVADWTPLVPAPATVDRHPAVLAELRRMFDEAFPDGEDSDYHYGSERLVDLVRDRIEKLEAAAPAVPAADEDQVQRTAEALRDWYLNRYLDAPSDPEHWSDQNWREMARAAFAAMREVSCG